MSQFRKPYVKQILSDRYIVLFSKENNMFIEHVIAFCKSNNIQLLQEKTKTGRIKFRLDYCDHTLANKLKLFLKNNYDEFHHYNKEMMQSIKHNKI